MHLQCRKYKTKGKKHYIAFTRTLSAVNTERTATSVTVSTFYVSRRKYEKTCFLRDLGSKSFFLRLSTNFLPFSSLACWGCGKIFFNNSRGGSIPTINEYEYFINIHQIFIKYFLNFFKCLTISNMTRHPSFIE